MEGTSDRLVHACAIGNLNEISNILYSYDVFMRYREYIARVSCIHNHKHILKYLISMGYDISDNNYSSLRWAVMYGSLDVVRYIYSSNVSDYCYRIGLSYAIRYNKKEVAEYIAKRSLEG